MKAPAYAGPDGIMAARERTAFPPILAYETKTGLPAMVALWRAADGDDLECFKDVVIFGLRLKPGTTTAEAQALVELLRRHGIGWEAIYQPPDEAGGLGLMGIGPKANSDSRAPA